MTTTKRRPAGAAALDRATPLLRDRHRAVFRRLPLALGGNEEALHDMRIAARRLRVALPLLATRPDGSRVRRSLRILRQVTRAAGASRDLDVVLALAVRTPAVTSEAKVLMRRLRATRTRSRHRMSEALLDLEIARLRRDLRVVVGRRADVLFVTLRRLRETRDALGAECLALIETLGERYDAAALHRLRIRIRRLRYLAEISDAFRGQTTTAATELRILQDQLGRLHDAHVLAAWFAAQATAARRVGASPLAAEAAARGRAFVEASRAEHAEYLAGHPADAIRRALAALSRARPAA